MPEQVIELSARSTIRVSSTRVTVESSSVTRAITGLSLIIGALALVAAGAGLFWTQGSAPATFVTVRGETIDLYARGLYAFDSAFKGAGNRGTDLVTLALALPLLLVSLVLFRRGRLRGRLLLTGTLFYFLYVYASVALSTAYNDLFLVYIALFSASLFAFILAFAATDTQELAQRMSPAMPRRGPGIFMLASGLVTLVMWLTPLVGAVIDGTPPGQLATSTVLVTDVLDLGFIVPALLLSGLLILRGQPLGYLIALSLLVLEVMLAPAIAAQTAFQVEANVEFTTGAIVGPIAGFVVLALVALWVLVTLLRNIGETPPV